MHSACRWQCIFGCTDAEDVFPHYMECQTLWQFARETLRHQEDSASIGSRLCIVNPTVCMTLSYMFVEEAYNNFVNDHTFPFLYKHFDFLGNNIVDKNLGNNGVFKNLTVFFYSYYKAKYENLAELKDMTDDVLQNLRKELEIN